MTRFMSVVLGLLCLPLLAVTIILSPVIVPALFLLALIVPGFDLVRRTSDRHSWNLVGYHSPHSLTWRWFISFSLPRSRDEGRWIGFFHHGRQTGIQIARCCLLLHTQSPMWYRDLYHRARDEAGQLSGRAWLGDKHPNKVRTPPRPTVAMPATIQ